MDYDPEEYTHAFRVQLAERRALWAILQEFVGRYASSFENPKEAIENLSERVMTRLDRKDDDAMAKGLELPLATVKDSVDRFFSELASRHQAGEL